MSTDDLSETFLQALPILDPEALEEAIGPFGEETVALLRFFLASTRPLLDALASEFAAGNLAAAAEAAHSAKGAANMSGAERLGTLCARIEQALRSGDEGQASRLIAVLPRVFSEVEAAVDRSAASVSSN